MPGQMFIPNNLDYTGLSVVIGTTNNIWGK